MFRRECRYAKVVGSYAAIVGWVLCGLAYAQQPGCSIPVAVWNSNVGVVPTRGLPREAFTARNGNRPVLIRSAAADWRPRRVIFVAESSGRMASAARQIEAAVITDILARSRAEDSFALLISGDPGVELRFGSSAD